jgi:hypothetical protein
VTLVRTEVSEERITSIIKVTRIIELGTTVAVTKNSEAIGSFETSVLTRGTLIKIPGNGILQLSRCFLSEAIGNTNVA